MSLKGLHAIARDQQPGFDNCQAMVYFISPTVLFIYLYHFCCNDTWSVYR